VVTHREEKGPFQSAEELLAVSGIGEATLEKIRPYIEFG
jgi:competence protein ComEA